MSEANSGTANSVSLPAVPEAALIGIIAAIFGLLGASYNRDMLSEIQIDAYLQRIGIDAPALPDKDTLDALVFAHQCNIPFSTVILHRSGRTPSLVLGDIYDKVIIRRLGGYCFELNKLFCELLRSLGFNARPALSRSVRGREQRMPINHMAILVELEGVTYFADVGFGGPMPAGALALHDGIEQKVAPDTFVALDIGDSWWSIDRMTRGSLDTHDDEVGIRQQTELELCTAFAELQDFDSLNAFFSKPGTLFHDHEIANLRTPQGYRSLRDGILTIREMGHKEVRDLTPSEIDAVLVELFGMEGLADV